jgi:glycosyltransferase involved in cell wall biosynthesis
MAVVSIVGLTMMEAMMAGCVPIVADNGGPRVMVTEECGYKLPISSANKMAADIADIVVAIDRDREIIRKGGNWHHEKLSPHSRKKTIAILSMRSIEP